MRQNSNRVNTLLPYSILGKRLGFANVIQACLKCQDVLWLTVPTSQDCLQGSTTERDLFTSRSARTSEYIRRCHNQDNVAL